MPSSAPALLLLSWLIECPNCVTGTNPRLHASPGDTPPLLPADRYACGIAIAMRCALRCTYCLRSDFLSSSSNSAITCQWQHCAIKRRKPKSEKARNISMEATSSRPAVRFSPSSNRTVTSALCRCPFAIGGLPLRSPSPIPLAFRWTPANMQVAGIDGLSSDLLFQKSTSALVVLCKPAQHLEAVLVAQAA